MVAKSIFQATEGVVTVKAVTAGGGSAYTANVKNLTIRGGVREMDMISCFGSGVNVYAFEKNPTLIETELTMVKVGSNVGVLNQQRVMSGSPYDTTMPISVSSWGVRDYQTIIYDWRDSHDVSGAHLRFTMGSILATQTEMSISSDDHLEETVTFKCLPTNFKPEYTSMGVGGSDLP